MKKAFMKFAVVGMAVLLLLSGCRYLQSCSVPIDYDDYEPKKAACFQAVIDNEERLNAIIQKLETYNFNISFWFEDGAVKVSGDAAQAELELLIRDDEELMNDLLAVFQCEYVDAMTKTMYKYETEYSYTIWFEDIARGYSCFAALVTDPEDAKYYNEHIAGDWYYFMGEYE